MGIQVRAEICCTSYTYQNLNDRKLSSHLGNVGYEIIRSLCSVVQFYAGMLS